MSIADLLIIMLEAGRLCLYMRALGVCIGGYRVSRRIVAVVFTALWIFESFNRCLLTGSGDILLLDFAFFVVEVPFLFILSFCCKGRLMQRLLMAVLLPFIYWLGKMGILRAFSHIYSDGSSYHAFARTSAGSFRYLAATAVAVSLLGVLEMIWEKTVKSRQERERELLEQEIRIYENQFAVIRQSRQNIRSLKHDMKHHIKMLNDMITAGEKDAALEYLVSMGAFMENSEEYVASGNEKIDSILNYMIAKAKNAGIAVDWKIQIPEHLEIPAFDINVILSNLFENAMNALACVKEPSLHILMKFDRGVLCISMQNNYSKKNPVSDRSEEHGFGLKNIRRIAEKYQGSLTTTVSDGSFHASVLLFLNEA